MENTTKHKFVIIKIVHNKKVIKLLVQRRKFPYRTYLEWRETNPQPKIIHRSPEWIKDFVDRLNRGESKIL